MHLIFCNLEEGNQEKSPFDFPHTYLFSSGVICRFKRSTNSVFESFLPANQNTLKPLMAQTPLIHLNPEFSFMY